MFACFFLAILMGFLWEGRPVLAQATYPVSDTSLELDDSDQPVIGYYDIVNQDLKQARWDGSVWQKEVVDSEGVVGEHLSLSLDSNDWSNIAYYDATNQDLKYAHWNGSSWQGEVIDSDNAGKYVSLALDREGDGRIAYLFNQVLKYWESDSGSFMQISSRPAEDISLQLNSADEPLISYYDLEDQILRLARTKPYILNDLVDAGGGDYGRHSSLVFDRAGRPHIAYYEEHNHDLRYAYWDGSAWQKETVDSSFYVGEFVSLALDLADRPHISYFDHENQDLKYAHRNGSSWQIETVETGAGHFTSIAIDTAGRPHISYSGDAGGPDGGLAYASWDGSSWQLEMVDIGEEIWPGVREIVGRYTSLALDASDNPHISYYDETNDDLKYAYWNGSSWQIERIDSERLSGLYTSLALDSLGNPYISYYDYDERYGALKYAHWNGSSWQIEAVDTSEILWEEGLGLYTSIFLDTDNRPHISYYDEPNKRLKYAYFDGYAWQLQTVDSALEDFGVWIGMMTSLALDPGNNPHISYYDESNGALKYASWDGFSWQLEVVDVASQVGKYSSLGVDSTDHLHISYYDLSNKDLKYAYGEVSNWQLQVVDSQGEVGEFTSLDVDSSDHPHISYYDATNQDLKYARWDGSSWQRETVDSSGAVGLYTSLKLDSANQPHISYFNLTCTELKYASWNGSSWQVQLVDTHQVTCDKDGDINESGLPPDMVDLGILLKMIVQRAEAWLYPSDWWCRGDLYPLPLGDNFWNLFDLQQLICFLTGGC